MSLLRIGEVVDRYEVTGILGRGATGTVYAVRHQLLGLDRALKVLHAPDPALVARLLREGEVLGRLRHPNVVAVHDVVFVGSEDGTSAPALVLDHVDGPTLAQFLEQARPDLDDALRLFCGIVEGVAAAHDAGIVHRDLKPGNVLLDTSTVPPTPRIVDFGIARALGDVDGLTSDGHFLGTFGYAAPEQLSGTDAVGPTADVFSLGVLGYTLLAGRHPYAERDPVSVLAAMQDGRFVPLDAVSGIPVAWVEALHACLASSPHDRPCSARELASRLQHESTPLPTTHHEVHTAGSARPSSWVPLAVAVGVGLVGCAILGMGWQQASVRSAAAELDRMSVLAASDQPGHALAYARAAADLRGTSLNRRDVAEWMREGAAAMHLPVVEGSVTAVDIRDEQVVAAHESGVVTVYDAGTGEVRGEFDSGLRIPVTARISADGGRLYLGPAIQIGKAESLVLVRELPLGVPVLSVHEEIRSIVPSLDGRFICVRVVSGAGGSPLRIIEVSSGDTLGSFPGVVDRDPGWASCNADSLLLRTTDDLGVRLEIRPLSEFDGSGSVFHSVSGSPVGVGQLGVAWLDGDTLHWTGTDGDAWTVSLNRGLWDMYDADPNSGLFVGREAGRGWVVDFPGRTWWEVPELVIWRPTLTGRYAMGTSDGRVLSWHQGHAESVRQTGQRVLSVSEAQDGRVVASGLGGALAVWPGEAEFGVVGRTWAPLGSWVGWSTDVAWADGGTILRTDAGETRELAVLDAAALAVSASYSQGVAVNTRSGLYDVRDARAELHGRGIGRGFSGGGSVVVEGAFVEGAVDTLWVHKEGSPTLIPVAQLEAIVPTVDGQHVLVGSERSGQPILTRLDPRDGSQSTYVTGVTDVGGIALLVPTLDDGVLLGTWSGHLLVWGDEPNRAARVLGPIEGPVNAASQASDRRMAAGGWRGTLHVWDDDSLLWSTRIGASITGVAWSPDTNRLVVCDEQGVVSLLDAFGHIISARAAHTGKCDVRWTDADGPVSYGEDGQRLEWSAERLEADYATQQASGALTNLRVCKGSAAVVAVVPYPDPATVWAESAPCASAPIR